MKPGRGRKSVIGQRIREEVIAEEICRTATVFTTQEQLDAYLKKHPRADKSKHTVKEVDGDAPAKEETDDSGKPSGDDSGESGELKKPSGAEVKKADGVLKGLKNKFKESVGNALEKSSEAVLGATDKIISPKPGQKLSGVATVAMTLGTIAGAAGGAVLAAPIAGALGITGATGVLAATVLGLKGAGIGASVGGIGGLIGTMGAAATGLGIGVGLAGLAKAVKAAEDGTIPPELMGKIMDYIYSVTPEEMEAYRQLINKDGTLNKEAFMEAMKNGVEGDNEKIAAIAERVAEDYQG